MALPTDFPAFSCELQPAMETAKSTMDTARIYFFSI
jgi:hypothetical protein